MDEHDKRAPRTAPADPAVTGIVSLDSLDRQDVEPLPPSPPPYEAEPLFNKKVMLLWALGAAGVWFAVKLIFPIAVDSAKTAIIESVNQGSQQHPDATITITRNGKVITIRRAPPPGSAAAASPAPAAAPAAPTVQPTPAPARK